MRGVRIAWATEMGQVSVLRPGPSLGTEGLLGGICVVVSINTTSPMCRPRSGGQNLRVVEWPAVDSPSLRRVHAVVGHLVEA